MNLRLVTYEVPGDFFSVLQEELLDVILDDDVISIFIYCFFTVLKCRFGLHDSASGGVCISLHVFGGIILASVVLMGVLFLSLNVLRTFVAFDKDNSEL